MLLDVQKQQSGLERHFRELPEFQEILADMARRAIYRERVRDNYLFNHFRERKRRLAFMFLKEYTQTKLFEKRSLRLAEKVLRKKTVDRLFQAWRQVKYREKSNRLLHAYTKEYELQIEEHKKRTRVSPSGLQDDRTA